MTMTFTPRENFESFDGVDHIPVEPSGLAQTNANAYTNGSKRRFFADKLSVPHPGDYVRRPRLERLLKRSLSQVGVTLVTGRAATGKTALAANFARDYVHTIWYRVEAADSDWEVFSSYLFAGLNESSPAISENGVAGFIEKLLGAPQQRSAEPTLLVLDDIHNVFDTEWFDEFFLTLLYSLPLNTHLICLSRSLPVLPLWRLRSKQVLTVIDEKILAFNKAEVEEVCLASGIPVIEAAKLEAESFGRIGKLKALLENE